MVAIKLPDGSVMEMESGVSGFDIASKISSGLAKAALAVNVNGKLTDLTSPITTDATVTIITGKDKEGLEIIRHCRILHRERYRRFRRPHLRARARRWRRS